MQADRLRKVMRLFADIGVRLAFGIFVIFMISALPAIIALCSIGWIYDGIQKRKKEKKRSETQLLKRSDAQR